MRQDSLRGCRQQVSTGNANGPLPAASGASTFAHGVCFSHFSHNPRKRAQSPLNLAVRISAVVKRSGKDRPELIFSLFSSLRYTFWGNAYDPAQTEVRLQTVVPLRKTFANFCSAKICAGRRICFSVLTPESCGGTDGEGHLDFLRL